VHSETCGKHVSEDPPSAVHVANIEWLGIFYATFFATGTANQDILPHVGWLAIILAILGFKAIECRPVQRVTLPRSLTLTLRSLPLLAEATPLALSRLLNLYPVRSRKDKWPKHRKKDEILTWVVRNADQKEIKEFLNEYRSVIPILGESS
jgi:hypothetical protein